MVWSATTILTVVATALTALYLYFEHRFTFWRKRGVPSPKTLPFLGHLAPFFFGKKAFSKILLDFVLPFRDQGKSYCGVYAWGRPLLLMWDPEMIKQALCKDFSSFHDRGVPVNEHDALSQNLFNLSGTKWRNLRSRLSPTFTSGKLKLMFPLMRDIGDDLSTVLAEVAERSEKDGRDREVEVDKLLTRFSADVIGSVAFGIQCNTLRDESSEFLAMSKQIFRQSPGQVVRSLLEAVHPKLGKLLPFKLLFNRVHNFFITLMKDTVSYREEHKVERNDFVQLMMQLRDQDLAHVDPLNHMELTPGVMAAQGFIFFIAGLDNIANTVGFCLSRLAENPDLQDRVAAEVRDVLRQHDGELTYDALKKMELVQRTVLEGLRLWSPIGALLRKCNESTQVGDLLIEKDTTVMFVADAMHTDENIFPDPMRFDPERHTAEARSQRHPYSFLPFGEGPRICIAERFANLEMQLALATMLRDFKFSVGPGFEHEVTLDPKNFQPSPKNGFKLRVEVRG